MEKLNLLKNFNLYETGLLAEQKGQVIYLPRFIKKVVIENELTSSDFETYNLVKIIKSFNPEVEIEVLIKDEQSQRLGSLLKQDGFSVRNSEGDLFILFEHNFRKINVLKRKKHKKTLDTYFYKKRNQPEQTQNKKQKKNNKI